MSEQWWDEQGIIVTPGGYDVFFEEDILPNATIYRESLEFTETITVTAKPKWYGKGLRG